MYVDVHCSWSYYFPEHWCELVAIVWLDSPSSSFQSQRFSEFFPRCCRGSLDWDDAEKRLKTSDLNSFSCESERKGMEKTKDFSVDIADWLCRRCGDKMNDTANKGLEMGILLN